MAHISVRPAFTVMGVCLVALTAEAGISLVSLASSSGLGIAAVALAKTIHAMDNQRSALAEEVEAKIARRLKELDVNDSAFAQDYFEARLEQEIGRSKRYRTPLSVIFLEVGAAGIAEGSAVVAAGARLLRTEDTFAPVGRGEYAFFLPQTDQTGAQIVIARLADALNDFHPIFGSACLSPVYADASSLLAAARENAHRKLIARAWNESKAVS